jgi:hypothetical protein
MKAPAWQRKAGKSPSGGLNAKGRASAKAEGMNLKPPVKSGDNPRRASFLARMGNMAGPERDASGEPTRLLLSLKAWGASSKADAKAKAKAISARNKGTKK